MGYSTDFKGVLEFTSEATGPQLTRLSSILGVDIRDLPDLEKVGGAFWYGIDLEITADFAGLQWDGSQKTYSMADIVNTVIRFMREVWPDWGLRGRLDAQGEVVGDVWALEVRPGGMAKKIAYRLDGREVTCPHCRERIILDGKLVKGED